MKKILAMLLCVIMVVSMAAVVSADGATYTKVTSGELTSGQYVLVDANGNAPTQLDSGWLQVAQPTVEGDKVTDAKGAVWTITVTENGITLKDANGVFVAPKGGNSNGIIEGEYVWSYSFADGVFTISGQGEDTVSLASNVGSDFKYRGYKNGTIESQGQEKYPSLFTLYKLEGGSTEQPPVQDPVDPQPPVEEPVAPSVTVTPVTAPAEGTAYKFGLYQGKNQKQVYINGTIANDRYLGTTENVEEAVDTYVEAVEGGVKFYILVDGAKQYITVYNNEAGKLSVKFDAAGTSVYTYNAECNNWVTTMEGETYYLGTYNNFDTMSASKTSFISAENTGVSQFPAAFYTVTVEENNDPTGDMIGVVIALLAVSGMGITVLKRK